MEINYTFYFFAFFEKVITKHWTFCYWWDVVVLPLAVNNIEDKMTRVIKEAGL